MIRKLEKKIVNINKKNRMVKFSWLLINATNVFSLSLAVVNILISTYLLSLSLHHNGILLPWLQTPSPGVWPFWTTTLSPHLVVFGFNTVLAFLFFYLFVKIFLLDEELLLMVKMFSKSEVLSLSYVHSFHFVYSSRLFVISCFILEFFSGRECFLVSILTFFFNIRTYFFSRWFPKHHFS